MSASGRPVHQPAGSGGGSNARQQRTGEADRVLAPLEVWGQRLGLERIELLLEALGQPQRTLPTVLIAGTNGKGSTAALLTSIAQASGARCGLYTSPHLEQVEERLRFDGRSIGSAELAKLLTEVLEAAGRQTAIPPTYFEALTAAAFVYFSRQRADLAVFEVGLGGRLDATNVADPLLSIIASIGLDHQEHLGSTLARITREKAGIARTGRPLLTWARGQPTVRRALGEIVADDRGNVAEDRGNVAEDRGNVAVADPAASTTEAIEWIECDRQVIARECQEKNGRFQVLLETPVTRYRLDSPLVGQHQIANLSLAIRAAEKLGEAGVLAIDRATVERGVAASRWPGRLETVVLPDERVVLLDGAHNLPSARVLVRFLDQQGGEWDLLYGSLRGKRAQVTLPLIAERCQGVTLTQPEADRALEAKTLGRYLAGRNPPPRIESNLERALAMALSASSRPLLICGSLYVVGAARIWLRERFGTPAAAVD